MFSLLLLSGGLAIGAGLGAVGQLVLGLGQLGTGEVADGLCQKLDALDVAALGGVRMRLFAYNTAISFR